MVFLELCFICMLLLSIIVGLFRVFLGPTRADRMLAVQLCGTASVAIILLLAFIRQDFSLFDLALVIAVLAAMSTIGFVRLTWYNTDVYQDGGPSK